MSLVEQQLGLANLEDGTAIRFAVAGRGPVAIYVPGWVSHLELGWALSLTSGLAGPIGDERAAVSSVEELGKVLFTDYMFAFEVTSILIIASMVGAVVLARKREH